MEDSRLLFNDLSDESRNAKPSYYVMMRSLVRSRAEGAEASVAPAPDKEMDAYLDHLLKAFDDPEYLESARAHLHRYDLEAFSRLSRSTDARLKYTIYRTADDFLLVSIGVFDNPAMALMQRVNAGPAARRIQEPAEEAGISRGPAHYQFAYQYSRLVPRRRPDMGDVLDRLSHGLDRYTRMLAHLRGEYVDIMEQLGRGEVHHLERTVNEAERRRKLLARQDDFLDAYGDWRRAVGDAPARARLDETLHALRELDPDFDFSFEIPADDDAYADPTDPNAEAYLDPTGMHDDDP